MRPLALQIDTRAEEDEEDGFARPDVQASLSFQSLSGDLRLLSTSLHEYKFTERGLHRTAQQQQAASQFYEISDRDIRILEPLGEGASSTVYKGRFEREGCFVAVKRINCLDRDKRRQLMNDVRGLCDVHHPSLVAFLGAYRTADRAQVSIVLEYMDRGSLADLVKQAGELPEAVLSNITAQALEGLVYLHQTRRLVHRDIKPANVLLSGGGRAKIADFGISAVVDNTLAVCNTFLGTVTYMSPERISSRPYSFAADVWSLGLSLLECWLGRYPYAASEGPLSLMMQVLNDEVPLPQVGACSPAFRDFLRLCLQKDPAQRPPASALLRHPFVAQDVTHSADLRTYLSRLAKDGSAGAEAGAGSQQAGLIPAAWPAVSWEQEQAAAEQLLQRFYARLSSEEPAAALAALAADLAPDVRCSHEGQAAEGRAAALAQLRAAGELQRALGASRLALDCLQLQRLQGGRLLALAAGRIEVSEAGPLGCALLLRGEGRGGGGAACCGCFSQAFELGWAGGRLQICTSLFRHL